MTATRCLLLTAALWLGPARQAAQLGGGRDSVVYVVTPASRFEVKTGKAGLLGFAGHGHLVRARAARPEDDRRHAEGASLLVR